MGLFYESAIVQSGTTEGLKSAYEKYKKMLDGCLSGKGYRPGTTDNFNPGLSDFRKVTFMPIMSDDPAKPVAQGHVSMEVDFNKNIGVYTLLILIFEK